MEKRVNFAGCSGIGKTTLAQALSEQTGVPFISGSYSDLIPSTKNLSHSTMIMSEPEDIFHNDMRLMSMRRKLFKDTPDFICDRSFIDSAAYLIQKLSHRYAQCDMEDFIEKAHMLTLEQCPKIVFLPFTEECFQKWTIEPNGKRVSNKFYQIEVSCLMTWVLSHWGAEIIDVLQIDGETAPIWSITGTLPNGSDRTSEILVLETMDHNRRMDFITKFLSW